MTEEVRICISQHSAGVRLTFELPDDSGMTVVIPLLAFDQFMNLSGAVFVGVAPHAHMTFDVVPCAPEPSWQKHDLN